MPTTAGHHTRVTYLWEDSSGSPNFAGTPDDSTYKTFGSDVTVGTLEGSNQAVRVFDPGDREARNAIEQMFSGSWSVEFTLTNPWWLKAVLAEATASGTDPTTHTFDGQVPYSMRLIIGNENTGNERILKGCVVASARIQVSVNGMVTVSLDGAYADEEETSPGEASLQSQVTPTERPMTFAQASIARGGSTLGLVQSLSISIENNTDIIGELGSRVGVDYSPKVRSINVELGDIVDDDTELSRMYGDSAATTPETKVDNSVAMTATFDNGETGSSKNSLTINLSGNIPQSYSRSGTGDPEADLEGTLNEITPSIDATAENSTASPK